MYLKIDGSVTPKLNKKANNKPNVYTKTHIYIYIYYPKKYNKNKN